jgi:hypothetical protein
MSPKLGAATLDGWLVRNKGWAKTRVYKARKKNIKQTIKNKTKQSSQTHQTSYKYKSQRGKKTKEKIFQQLDLDGNNIDDQDGEAFADLMKEKAPKTRGIKSQNINGVPEHPFHFKSRPSDPDTDGWLLQETGLCWIKVGETGQWKERTRKSGIQLNSNFKFNSTELERSEALQAGGVAVITTNSLTPRCESSGGDDTGLGRWAWTRIEGADNIHTRLVSVYHPCEPTSPGPGTVYEQHRRFFGDEDSDPRQQLLDDLAEAITM